MCKLGAPGTGVEERHTGGKLSLSMPREAPPAVVTGRDRSGYTTHLTTVIGSFKRAPPPRSLLSAVFLMSSVFCLLFVDRVFGDLAHDPLSFCLKSFSPSRQIYKGIHGTDDRGADRGA